MFLQLQTQRRLLLFLKNQFLVIIRIKRNWIAQLYVFFLSIMIFRAKEPYIIIILMPWLLSKKQSLAIILGTIFVFALFWSSIIYTEEKNLKNLNISDTDVVMSESSEISDNRIKPSINKDQEQSHNNESKINAEPSRQYPIKSLILSPIANITNKIKCSPPLSGYTKHQSSQRYKYENRQLSCFNDPFEVFRIENNTLRMDCKGLQPAQYSLANSPESDIIGDVKYAASWKSYISPVDIGNSEFGFAKCGPSKKQGWLHNRFSPSASLRAQEMKDTIINKLNLKNRPKPLTVLVLLVDAVSRQHFYRTMNKTVDLLYNLNAESSDLYTVFDFFNGNSHGENTLPNLVPLLYGHTYQEHLLKTQSLSLKKADDAEKYSKIQEEIIWKHYEKYGFVTMFGWETRWDYFAEIGGRKVLCDHTAASFWRGAVEIAAYTDFIEKQRCIGNYHSHQYLLNYTKEFIQNYLEHNKFGYLHFVSGHEVTGSVVQMLDSDLSKFLAETIDSHRENDEDFAIFLVSDHGLHMGSWDRFQEGIIENLSPFTFLITNNNFLSKIGPNTRDILLSNTQRLISKFDLHLTLKHLAAAPYEDATEYSDWKKDVKISSPVSLLIEEISENRTCQDIGVPLYWCTCLEYNNVEIKDINALALHIANQTIFTINKKIQNDKADEFCLGVSLGEILKAEEETKESENYPGKLYKVTISIKEREGIIFSAFAYVADFIRDKKIDAETEIYPLSQFENFNVQIQKVIRVDETDHFCCAFSEFVGAKCSFCVCKYLETFEIDKGMSAKKKQTFDKLKRSVTIAIGNTNRTCVETCEETKKKCEEWGLPIGNKLDLLKEPWRSQSASLVYKDGGYLDFKSLRVDKKINGALPGLIYENKTYIFSEADQEKLACDVRDPIIMPICPCTLYSYN
ncbi:unnamed protein product [Blepharisma stoltei]|uniref:Uncharacterized protein n=1 Tax=Blepharisma stoltei TaxID=1481888 RepID=A0AAU9J6C2_9CILI|nr:unnamed protein product [Blepharisma stoltei]